MADEKEIKTESKEESKKVEEEKPKEKAKEEVKEKVEEESKKEVKEEVKKVETKPEPSTLPKKEVKEEGKKEEAKEKKEEKKEEPKKEGKVFTIPLRKAFRKSRGKRANYSIKLVKEFLIRHTKSEDVKLGKHLNQEIWERGAKKPPRRVRVNVVQEDKIAKAELLGHEYEEFKSLPKKEVKGAKEKLMERLGPKAKKKEEEEKMVKEKMKPEKPVKAPTEPMTEE